MTDLRGIELSLDRDGDDVLSREMDRLSAKSGHSTRPRMTSSHQISSLGILARRECSNPKCRFDTLSGEDDIPVP